MSDKVEQAKIKYSREINNIRHKLKLLEDGKIKELTGANMDGYLANNISKLRKELEELFSKVVNGSDSIKDEFDKYR